ncbi:MAG TPA: pirin-like C-terminal cupin domain-containing protein, partial [Marmoricola sp.]|nr:pirin-like C-terminal cupin domain-containing protein [Marmoricola sp.]
PLALHALGYLEPGLEETVLEADADTRLLLLGGRPLGEAIVMWWNFIGRDHDDIVAHRGAWEALLSRGEGDRFALPEDDPQEPLHAPALPTVRLVHRR